MILKPLENAGDPVWSVIIMLVILLVMTTWYIVYILRLSFKELEDGSDDTPKQEELLQLQGDRDKQSPRWGYDRCHHRSWIRFIQERTGKNCRS